MKTGKIVEKVILYKLCGRFLGTKKCVWSLVTFYLRQSLKNTIYEFILEDILFSPG